MSYNMLYLWPSIVCIILPYIGSESSSITMLSRPMNRKAFIPLSDRAKLIERPFFVFSYLISVTVYCVFYLLNINNKIL